MNARRKLALALAVLALAGCSESATVATFNIRVFPEPTTDLEAVAATIADTHADVLAVQEIRNATEFERMLARASERSSRDYRLVPGPCGGDGFGLTTGVVYDASRWTLAAQRQYPDLGRSESCGDWLPATAAVLDKGRRRLVVTSIHLAPFPDRFDERQQQWPRALELMSELEREFEPNASFMMGDTNSTGFRGEPKEEPDFVRSTVRKAGRDLLTDDTACTEYWLPREAESYQPSLLDHIVTRGGQWGEPQVQGLCARLKCESAPKDAMDPEFDTVSDHCPVVVAGKL
jgi:endonuclease/exonuclease/phosphatase family metal-dependent hydrolase